MKNIAIILLFVIAIACSSKLKKKESAIEEQAVSVVDEKETLEQEMLGVNNKVVVKEIKMVEEKTVIKKQVQQPVKKMVKNSGMMIFDKATKAMIDIENCSHVIYNKQFSQPTCLKTL